MTTTDAPVAPVGPDALAHLRELVEGPVLDGAAPEAAAELAGFQLAVQHQPTVVVGATNAQDVAVTVRWAADRGLGVAVQSTGHGAVPVIGGVVITTSRMNAVAVDPVEGTATLEAGARWRDVVAQSAPHGLMPLVGSSQGVGAFGYTLGGGLGLFARKHGYAADHVQSLQLVTADGSVRHVDAESDPDLFWAIRGGKGSLGIVTAMTVDLVPSELWGGPVFFDADHAREVLLAYRAWTDTLPDEAMTSIAILRMPPAEEVPEPLRGRTVVHLRYTHCGDPAAAEALLAPMLGAGPVIMAMTGPLDPHATDIVHMDPPEPMPSWEQGAMLADLTEEAIDALLAVAGPQHDIPVPVVEIRQLGAALARQPQVPNAVPGREAGWTLLTIGVLAPGLEEVTPHVVAGIVEALRPWQTGTTMLNWLGGANAAPARVQAAFDEGARARLLSVKRAVDPHNVFRHGHALL